MPGLLRTKPCLAAALGVALAAGVYYAGSEWYIRWQEHRDAEQVDVAQAAGFARLLEAVIASNKYSDINQLRDPARQAPVDAALDMQLPGIKYACVMDRSGFVVLHTDKTREGKHSEFEAAAVDRVSVRHTTVHVADGAPISVFDVTCPVHLDGRVQGMVRVGFAHPTGGPRAVDYRVARQVRTMMGAVSLALLLAVMLLARRCVQREHETVARADAGQSMRQLELIGTGFAHEIKNALNGIRMNAQLLRDQLEKQLGREAEPHVRKIARIEREAARTGAVVNDFLLYAKPAAFRPAVVNLTALLEDLAQFFDAECRARQITLTPALDQGLAHVIADEQQLRHAVSNLLWNAIHAIGSGGAITLAAHRRADEVLISVADTGGGVDAAVEQQIFDAFFTTKQDGVGLGLCIVQRVAEQHSGAVSLQNNPGRGCTFTLSFPFVDDPR